MVDIPEPLYHAVMASQDCLQRQTGWRGPLEARLRRNSPFGGGSMGHPAFPPLFLVEPIQSVAYCVSSGLRNSRALKPSELPGLNIEYWN